MSQHPVGIDLGTSTSLLCVFQDGKPVPVQSPLAEGRSPVAPSLLGCPRDRDEVVVGYQADRFRTRPGCFVQEVKRKMGTDERVQLGPHAYRPQEISAMILRRLVESASAELGGRRIDEAVISVPANFKDAARQATLDAAHIAGLKVPLLIPEPTAAALAFGVQNLDADERVIVFDFGGGTLDISLLQMCEGVIDVERIDGDAQLGGKDFDAALLDWVKSEFTRRNPGAVPHDYMDPELRRKCEQAKIRLSTHTSEEIYVPSYAAKGSEAIPLEVRLLRVDLDRLVAPLVNKSGDCLRRLLNGSDSMKRIDPRSVSRVLMVGGTTYIPVVRRRVAEIIGREVSVDVHPDMAVGMGACVRAAIHAGVAGDAQAIVLADVSPFSIGVEVVAQLREDAFVPGVFSPLLERNQPIPHRSAHVYNLVHPQQSEVAINVYQGNGAFVVENELLARARVEKIPPSTNTTPRELHINFSFDASGIASLDASVPNTSCRATLSVDPRQGRMSDAERRRSAELLSKRLEDSPRYAGASGLLDRANTLTERHGAANVPAIVAATELLKRALAEGRDDAIDAAEDALTDALLTEGNVH